MPATPSPKVIPVSAADTPRDLAAKLVSAPTPVLIVLGQYDAALGPQVRSLFIRSVLDTAADSGLLVMDDGAKTGCAADIANAALEQDAPPVLAGVTSSADYDPNHAFILQLQNVDPQQLMQHLAAAVANVDEPAGRPVLLMVVGGGDTEKTALVRAARREWPLILVGGAGGVADDVLNAKKPPPAGATPAPIQDPVVREIVEIGSIRSFDLNGNMDDLRRILSAQFQKSLEGLQAAWQWYDDLDKAAIAKQNSFRTLQGWLLVLAIVATLLAILSQRFLPWDKLTHDQQALWLAHRRGYEFGVKVLKYAVLLVPIIVTVLTAMNSRFRSGNKWILFRATAEAIKREIFRYRAQAGAYSDAQCTQTSSNSKLAVNVKDLTESLFKAEVNKTSIVHQDPAKANPGRASFLDPDQYITQRLDDQKNYFFTKTKELDWQLRSMYVLILVAGALGTLLAAIGLPVWVALTTAFATALTTKLEIDQAENSLVQYNAALTGLRNIESWWSSLSQWERGRQRNIDLLVDQTETVLAGELAGWVQQMQSTLDKLTEKEEKSDGQGKTPTP